MGRIKTMFVKRNARKLISEHGQLFNSEFESNKKAVGTVADIPSKKMRNVMTGYISRLVRNKNKIMTGGKHGK